MFIARGLPFTLGIILWTVPERAPGDTVFDVLPKELPLYRAREDRTTNAWFWHVAPSPRDMHLELQLWSTLTTPGWFHGTLGERVVG